MTSSARVNAPSASKASVRAIDTRVVFARLKAPSPRAAGLTPAVLTETLDEASKMPPSSARRASSVLAIGVPSTDVAPPTGKVLDTHPERTGIGAKPARSRAEHLQLHHSG